MIKTKSQSPRSKTDSLLRGKKTWQKVKLEDIVIETRDLYHPSKEEHLPYIGLEHIQPNTLRVTEIGDSANTQSIKKKFVADDVLFGSLRAYFRKVIRPKIDGVCSTDITVLRTKNKELDQKFLFYLVCNPQFINRASIQGEGTRMPRASWNVISKFDISIPEDINEQKRIAEILSAFDDKIEVNNKISRTLEEIAQTIFKEWFQKFNFPVELVKSEKLKVKSKRNVGYKGVGGKMIDSELGLPAEALAKAGKIPGGWEVRNIMEIIKRLPVGKRYDNKTALPKGKIPILDQGQSGIIGFHNEEPSVKASIKNPVAVFSNHTCYYRLITYDFSCIQNVIPYIGMNGYPTLFVYYLTRNKIKMSDYKGHWPEFAAQKFIVPPQPLAMRFSQKIQPFIENISKNKKENQTLVALRDLLLPKLMSGKIRV